MRIGPARAGRFTPAQAAQFGQGLTRGCGYVALGRVALLFNLPRRLEVADPTPTLFDLNAHLRQRAEAALLLHED